MSKLCTVFKPVSAIYFLLVFICCSLNIPSINAQNSSAITKITGTVTDSLGQPLPLVSVQVKDSRNATTTNQEGVFELNTGANATLVFSYVGFTSKQINLNGKTNIDVQLRQTSNSLGDVVVTALGITNKDVRWVILYRSKRFIAY